MAWPEDNVIFEDPPHHVPLVGDSLTEAELAAVIQGMKDKRKSSGPNPLTSEGGFRGLVLPKKIPCEGSTTPEIDRTFPEVLEEFKNVAERQDKLAGSVHGILGDHEERLKRLERRAGGLTESQVNSIIAGSLFIFGIFVMGALSIAMHLSGIDLNQ